MNLAFICPKCRNKTMYDVDNEVTSKADVDYNDRFICEECGFEALARPQYDGSMKWSIPKAEE